ncbi:MAG: LytTR family transcriptional regulator DNA-binding domain-containing protein [Cyclobacteriaceae bacterium]
MKKRYIILLAVVTFFLLTAGLIYSNRSKSSVEITSERFEQMLSEGDIKEAVLVSNQDMVEVTLNDWAKQKPTYFEELAELSPLASATGPHYRIKVGNPDIFDREFMEAQESLPQSEWIGYQVEERSGYGSFLLNWGLVLVFYAGIFGIPIYVFVRSGHKPKYTSEDLISSSGAQENLLSKAPSAEKLLINFPHKLGDRVIFTPIEEITCFFAQDNHVYLYDVYGKERLVEHTLTDMESKLPAQFIRVHRAYIINSHLIQEVKKQPGSRFAIKMRDEQHKEIVTGQSYAAPVKQLLEI